MCKTTSSSESMSSSDMETDEMVEVQVVQPIPHVQVIPIVEAEIPSLTLSFRDLIEDNEDRTWNIHYHDELPSLLKTQVDNFINALSEININNMQHGINLNRAMLLPIQHIVAIGDGPYSQFDLIQQAYGQNIAKRIGLKLLNAFQRINREPASLTKTQLIQDIDAICDDVSAFRVKSNQMHVWIKNRCIEKQVDVGVDLNDGEIAFYSDHVKMNTLIEILQGRIRILMDALHPTHYVSYERESFDQLSSSNQHLVDEGFSIFHHLTNLRGTELHGTLDDVSFDTSHPFMKPGAIMNSRGVMSIGIAAIPTQIVHELGHHIENNLNIEDFLTLHNFLRGRSRVDKGGIKQVGHPIHEMLSGIGYDAFMPPLTFMSKIDHLLFENKSALSLLLKNIANLPGWTGKIVRTLIDTCGYAALGSAIGAVVGSIVPGAGTVAGAITGAVAGGVFGLIKGLFHSSKKKQDNVRNYFYEVSNSEDVSYATMFQQAGNPEDKSGRTEYLSTTYELMASDVGRKELIKKDPLRVVLFLYLANKLAYRDVKNAYEQAFEEDNLDERIHVVKVGNL